MAIDIEAYYTRYGAMVLRRCRGLLRDEEKARDAMHDVFVQLLRHESKLVVGPGDRGASSLLYRIATNVCLNRLRSEGRRPEDAEGELVARIAMVEDDSESRTLARASLRRIFGREKESTRVIAVMHLVDGMTHEEVAAAVGMSVSGVRKRLRVLRQRLAAEEVAS